MKIQINTQQIFCRRVNLVFNLHSVTYFIKYLVTSDRILFLCSLLHADFLIPCTVWLIWWSENKINGTFHHWHLFLTQSVFNKDKCSFSYNWTANPKMPICWYSIATILQSSLETHGQSLHLLNLTISRLFLC